MTQLAITTQGLTRRYGASVALHPLTLNIPTGEVFGFLGHNGAGKTTTIRLLTTLIEPSGGSASIGGFDLNSDPMGVRGAIGYLPENVRLYDNFTTAENLMFFAKLSGVKTPEDRVREVLDFLNITELADRKVGQFSKGMRQRVGIAQAILHRPSILFLDEPTSGLDPMGVRMLREVIDALNATGMTIFMNTHLLSEVSRSCTSIGVLSHGKLVFQDSMEAVTARYHTEGALEELYMSVAPEVAA
jgi:ABC-2 type transport system ATP-binding protein